MAKGILGTRRQKRSIWSPGPFRHSDDAVVVSLQSLVYLGKKPLLIKWNLRQQQDVWSIAFLLGGERTGGGRPTGMPTHHLQSKHLGRGGAHGRQIERRLAQ